VAQPKPATTAAPWTYSRLHSFETCAKQYFHTKVTVEYPDDPNSEYLIYGNRLHAAAEHYVRDKVPLPDHFQYLKAPLDALMKKGDMRLCEYQMGLTVELEPCTYFAKNIWWRGVVDLLILDSKKGIARVVDYKSGKDKYADKDQIELMALGVFKHFPVVNTVHGALFFAVAGTLIKDTYTVENEAKLWAKWRDRFSNMESAYTNDVWNPNPSGLCHKHCPVLECPHNGRN
jgi:hypothetical protein